MKREHTCARRKMRVPVGGHIGGNGASKDRVSRKRQCSLSQQLRRHNKPRLVWWTWQPPLVHAIELQEINTYMSPGKQLQFLKGGMASTTDLGWAASAGVVVPERQEPLRRTTGAASQGGRCAGRQVTLFRAASDVAAGGRSRRVEPTGAAVLGRQELMRRATRAAPPGGRRCCSPRQAPLRRVAGAAALGGKRHCCGRQEPLRWAAGDTAAGGRSRCARREETPLRAAGAPASGGKSHSSGRQEPVRLVAGPAGNRRRQVWPALTWSGKVPPAASGPGEASLLGGSFVGWICAGGGRQHNRGRSCLLGRRKACSAWKSTCAVCCQTTRHCGALSGETPLTRQLGRRSWCCWPSGTSWLLKFGENCVGRWRFGVMPEGLGKARHDVLAQRDADILHLPEGFEGRFVILCDDVAGIPVVSVHTRRPRVCVPRCGVFGCPREGVSLGGFVCPHEGASWWRIASLWRVCGFTRGGLVMGVVRLSVVLKGNVNSALFSGMSWVIRPAGWCRGAPGCGGAWCKRSPRQRCVERESLSRQTGPIPNACAFEVDRASGAPGQNTHRPCLSLCMIAS